MGRRKKKPFKHGMSAPAPQGAAARTRVVTEPGEPVARLGDTFGDLLGAIKVAAPVEPPTQEARPSASVLRLRPRDAGEELSTIEELRRVNMALQARLESLEGRDRQTLEALSNQVRERDERIRELERSVRALEAELSARGEGANHLHLRERELAARIEALEAELTDAHEALLDAQAQDDETVTAALIAAFCHLVTRDLPAWSDRRELFLRNAQRVRQRAEALRNDAQRTLFLLRSSLERAEDLTGELALKRAGATGVDADELNRHALAREIKDLWETWQELSRGFDEKRQEREEFLLRDADDRRARDQLRGKIESFARAFALADLDVWELASLERSVLALLDDRPVEIDVVHATLEIDRVSAAEQEDIARATTSIVSAPPPVEKPRSGAAQTSTAATPVTILPGCVFPAQHERELERLCLLVVLAWEQADVPRRKRLTVVEIRQALLEAGLVRKDIAAPDIREALKTARHVQALASSAVRNGDYPVEVFSSAARAPVCRDEALALLPTATRDRVLELIASAVHTVASH